MFRVLSRSYKTVVGCSNYYLKPNKGTLSFKVEAVFRFAMGLRRTLRWFVCVCVFTDLFLLGFLILIGRKVLIHSLITGAPRICSGHEVYINAVIQMQYCFYSNSEGGDQNPCKETRFYHDCEESPGVGAFSPPGP